MSNWRNMKYNASIKERMSEFGITGRDLLPYWRGGGKSYDSFRMHINSRQQTHAERRHVNSCIDMVLSDREGLKHAPHK